jgi:SNF2 family DNA or RNA helicase
VSAEADTSGGLLAALALLDARYLPPRARAEAAWLAHEARDVEWLDNLPAWNYELEPRRHQRAGIAWLYFMTRALLADQGGLGKTVTVAGLLALMEATGELAPVTGQGSASGAPALLIVRAAAMAQWHAELRRFVPGIKVITLDSPADKSAGAAARSRVAKLLRPGWHAALISPEMLASKVTGARAMLSEARWSVLVCDDVEVLKNQNKTARAVRNLAMDIPRVIVSTATPLDKRLTQLYDTGTVLRWQAILGSREEFRHHYVTTEKKWYTPKLKPTVCTRCQVTLIADWKQKLWTDSKHRPGPCPGNAGGLHVPRSRIMLEPRFTEVETGVVPQLVPEFRARIAPLVLRRTAADADDIAMPAVQLNRVWVDLKPAQAERYEEIRKGVLVMAGRKVPQLEAKNLWLRAWQVTSSLATLDGAEPLKGSHSAKVEEAVDRVTGDYADEPVVIYSYFKATITHLANSLEQAGVTASRLWGDSSAYERNRNLDAWNAGRTRVLLITDAGGMGLNLQKARRLILVDTPRSAARVSQLIWRVRRDGSEHETVYIDQLLSRTPVDLALATRNLAEQAMSDAVLDGAELDAALEEMVTAETLLKEVTG